MADLNVLKAGRKSTKASMSRIIKFIEQFDLSKGNVNELIVRRDQLETYFQKYEDIQYQLETADYDTYNLDRQDVESKYYSALAKVKSASELSNSNSFEIKPATQIPETAHVNLPVLNLPQFSGDYHSWYAFKDLFMSLIDANVNLNSVQKLYYLKSSLKGEPLHIINSLALTNENYIIALQLLKDRYDNQYLVVNSHVKAIFDLTPSTKGTVSQLRELVSIVKQHLNSLAALGLDTKNWDPLVIYLLSSKVDSQTRKAWELQRKTPEIPTLKDYFMFLEHRCNALELSTDSTSKSIKTTSHITTNYRKGCVVCNKDHYIQNCPTFIQQNVETRRQTVRKHNLCFNCLRQSHQVSKCKSSSCKTCGHRHNTLLHISTNKANVERMSNVQVTTPKSEQVAPTSLVMSQRPTQILLCTARVLVMDHQGKFIQARALLDSGSQCNFVTNSLAQRLKLKPYTYNNTISGISNTTQKVDKALNILVSSRINQYKHKLTFLMVDQITCQLPHTYIDVMNWPISKNAQLADPSFFEPSEIELLIGADLFFDILRKGHCKLGPNLPSIHNTQFGWIVSGSLVTNVHSNPILSVNTCTHSDLCESITQFWRLEEVTDKSVFSAEEKQCEQIFKTTTVRDENGKYEVELPLVSGYEYLLGDSYNAALFQFRALERKFIQNPSYFTEYKQFIDEYLKLGHATLLQRHPCDVQSNQVEYYLPHHAVFRPESLSTRIRVVFNASIPTTSGKSLNDVLMVGPSLQCDLFDIVLRFRTHRYVISCDIIKMFRQIKIKPCHQPLLRILWRENPFERIQIIQLLTVTYGTACAPYLAQRCLLQLAEDESDKFPLAANALKLDTYMDDILTGANSIEELLKLKSQLIELLKRGGFFLHKWRSNVLSALDIAPNIGNVQNSTNGNIETLSLVNNVQPIKALGLNWIPETDIFSLSIPKDLGNAANTKREVLSCISKIFDPLGLVTPVTIKAKLIMQNIWTAKLNWDDTLPPDILRLWEQFIQNIHHLQSISISRFLFKEYAIDNIQLHGYCDASQRAYGACFYIRTQYTSGIVDTNLVVSKSRVAPLKVVSLPRLELCGALLLARLLNKVRTILSTIKIDRVFLWTDSTIVLSWIASPSNKWTVFVSHRVSEIQDLTQSNQWHHIGTAQNIADIISRGVDPSELSSLTTWWHGPSFLKDDEDKWPKIPKVLEISNLPEKRKLVAHTRIESNWSQLFQRFSSYNKLIRTFAYVLRFKNILNVKSETRGDLSLDELNKSLELIVRLVQQESFSNDIKVLKQNGDLRKSNIKLLNPFLDENGLLRVGGRLQNAQIPFDFKHPLLLPAHNHVTTLIIRNEHQKLLHAGIQTVLANIRTKFWPIDAKREIKRVILNCIVCARYKTPTLQQLMGDLPFERVTPSRVFQFVGVDYCGPIPVKETTLRRSVVTKGYIAVFVCMTSKAVHLELVSKMTTEAFLAALQRFIARRNIPSKLFSDNGTNFRGAANEMNRLYAQFVNKDNKKQILDFAYANKIDWKFIPPNSPHWGGLWEAAVKSVKFHLIRITGNSKFTFEELCTLLCQIENVLNSRPLYAISNDPNDFSYLSPAHLITGDYLKPQPELDLKDCNQNTLSVYQQISKMKQNFWSKWSKDYLTQLQSRPKWQNKSSNLMYNDLVLVRDDNLPPSAWALGRVIETYPGADGRVRVVLIKTASGTYKRPITKLSLLPVPKSF